MNTKSDRMLTRAFLMHVSHYDPAWLCEKPHEEPFDPEVAKKVIDGMAAQGLNLLVIDCEDGVAYRSHPELRRHYTVPMRALEDVAAYAHARGIDVAPKLNFAKSGRNQHDQWMAPHVDLVDWLANMDVYWKVASDLIGELVAATRPTAFFHVGMDEDHYRSVPQYVQTILKLRRLVAGHRLRTVVWNDSCLDRVQSIAQVHAEKCRAAEPRLPRDIVHVLWNYNKANPAVVQRLTRQGFCVWGAPSARPLLVKKWRQALLANGGTGMLLTNWIKCCKRNEKALLATIEAAGGMGRARPPAVGGCVARRAVP